MSRKKKAPQVAFEDTYICKLLASAPYKREIPRPDGSTLIVFSFRPIEEAARDMFVSAAKLCKPVPTVLGQRAVLEPADQRERAQSASGVNLGNVAKLPPTHQQPSSSDGGRNESIWADI